MNATSITKPAESASPYAALTLEQLKAQYAAWLEAGAKIAPVLKKILITLGQPHEPIFQLRQQKKYVGIASNGWQAYYREESGCYDTIRQDYTINGLLSIDVGNQTPVWLCFQNGKVINTPDSVFIPGRWVDELLALEANAESTIEARKKNTEQSELDHLRALMGVGVLI